MDLAQDPNSPMMQLREPLDVTLRELVIDEVSERRASPESNRCPGSRTRGGLNAIPQRRGRLTDEALKPASVDRLNIGLKDIPGTASGDHLTIALKRLA
jgi:hypothetical protein